MCGRVAVDRGWSLIIDVSNADFSDLEAIEWIYKVPQAVLLLCNLVFLVWIMAVSRCGVLLCTYGYVCLTDECRKHAATCAHTTTHPCVCVMAPTGTFTRVALLPSLPSADSRLGIWGLYNEASSRRHSASAPARGGLVAVSHSCIRITRAAHSFEPFSMSFAQLN